MKSDLSFCLYSICKETPRPDGEGVFLMHGSPFMARNDEEARCGVLESLKKNGVNVPDLDLYGLYRLGSFLPERVQPLRPMKRHAHLVCRVGELLYGCVLSAPAEGGEESVE